MSIKDPRVDKYIKAAKPFAQPILNHFRNLVHKNCPDVQETIKWGFPNFEYKGTFCAMASFKEHCAITFFKAALIKDLNFSKVNSAGSAGHLGRIIQLSDLPSDKVLSSYIIEAVKINEEGKKVAPHKKAEPVEIIVPEILVSALKKNKKAKEIFEKFSPSHKKEYINWINEAKTDTTRDKRIETTIEWIKEGKTRMWKYQSK